MIKFRDHKSGRVGMQKTWSTISVIILYGHDILPDKAMTINVAQIVVTIIETKEQFVVYQEVFNTGTYNEQVMHKKMKNIHDNFLNSVAEMDNYYRALDWKTNNFDLNEFFQELANDTTKQLSYYAGKLEAPDREEE